MARLDSLEDIIGEHVWIGVSLLIGGVWHILVTPKKWKIKLLGTECILSSDYYFGWTSLARLSRSE